MRIENANELQQRSVSFSTSAIKDADKSGAPYSTSTPITVE